MGRIIDAIRANNARLREERRRQRRKRRQRRNYQRDAMRGRGSRHVDVEVPRAFYDDHVARDLPAGRVLKETARLVTVRLTRASYDDLLDDARYYASEWPYFDPPLPGLGSSARATVRRLEAVRRP